MNGIGMKLRKFLTEEYPDYVGFENIEEAAIAVMMVQRQELEKHEGREDSQVDTSEQGEGGEKDSWSPEEFD